MTQLGMLDAALNVIQQSSEHLEALLKQIKKPKPISLTAIRKQLADISKPLGHALALAKYSSSDLKAGILSLSMDNLTGLLTRKEYDRALPQLVQKLQEEEEPGSLAVLDLDWFKPINDQYGHTVGDHVLRAFGRIVQTHLGRQAQAFRYGGEEIVIVSPETVESLEPRLIAMMKDAEALGDHLPDLFSREEDAPIREALEAVLTNRTLSASVGIAEFSPEAPVSAEAWFEQADTALYAAKHGGRNQIHTMTSNDPDSLKKTYAGKRVRSPKPLPTAE